jgi:DNA-binding NarL/FixJ family response regulator
MTTFQRRVLVVEDDGLMGSLMAGALANEGFVSQSVSSAMDAKGLLKSFDPDVVVVDIDLGEGPSGIDFVQMMRRSRPDVAAVLLSKHADSHSAGFASTEIPDGVAYLRKSLVHDTKALVDCIESTIRGNAESLRQDKEPGGMIGRLSKGQREILHLMAKGYTNQEIAKRRGVSLSNVEQRVSEIFRVLDIRKGDVVPRVEAIRLYISHSGVPDRSDHL